MVRSNSPNLSQPQETSAKKRKRRPSANNAEEPGHDSSDYDTNSRPSSFISRSARTLSQFALAGLSEADIDPRLTIPHFPHRGLGREQTEDEEKSDVDGDQQRKSRPREDDRKGHLDVLLRSIEQFLDQGEISKAARAYGLVLQLRPRSLPIDIRLHNLWAIGAEILMRQGEEQQKLQQLPVADHGAAGRRNGVDAASTLRMPAPRWGSAANMSKAKAYFETLIRQHPYDNRFPDRVSAIDFLLAMLSCEVYNAHAEYTAGLARLNEQAGDWDDDYAQEDELGPGEDGSFVDASPGFGADGSPRLHNEPREERLNKRKDELRKLALGTMRDITQRMEKLMEQPPYSRNGHFLRLRAAASLFAADVCIPMSDMSPLQRREAETRRNLEQRVARNAMQELEKNGTDADTIPYAMFDSYLLNREHLTTSPAHLYSSLPIREV